MLWPWALGCFVIWLLLGSLVWRNLPAIRMRLALSTRRTRIAQGTGLLFGTAALLVAGFFGLMSRGGSTATLSPFEWLAVAAIGGLFVLGQSLAAAILFSVVDPGVTNRESAASMHKNLEGKDS